jgi:hypothetical protein
MIKTVAYFRINANEKDEHATAKRIDQYKKLLIMNDDRKIQIEDIYKLESELFRFLDFDV